MLCIRPYLQTLWLERTSWLKPLLCALQEYLFMPRIERALLSVTDKTGVVPFATKLHEMGVELISTGGTARRLRQSQIPVRDIAEITGFPEMLDGRVKTIHPRIAGGILAVRTKDHMAALRNTAFLAPFDMVVVNLYEFAKFANKPGRHS